MINATVHVSVISPIIGRMFSALESATPLEARAAIPICVQPKSEDALPMFLVKGDNASAVALGLHMPMHARARKNIPIVENKSNQPLHEPNRKIKLVIT